MKKFDIRACIKNIPRILLIALLAFFLDYLIVQLTDDESIWLGESIEVVGSAFFGPFIGGMAALINCAVSDYLLYGSFEYSYLAVLEIISVVLIGMIFKRLCKDDSKFGVREILIFNFVQLLINVCVLFLATPPLAITFFGFLTEDWTKGQFAAEMASLRSYAFSSGISVALIGTPLMAAGTYIRRKYREHGSISGALRSIMKRSYLTKEYRKRALEYSVGFVFAVALTMIDGVVSGHILGLDALAATSILFPLVTLSTFCSNLISTGCSTLCAVAKGERNHERSNRLFTLGLMATFLIGLLQTLLFWFLKDYYFRFYPATESIQKFAEAYYDVYIFVPPFMALVTFLDEIISSEGDDMLAYTGYMGALVINVVLSVILSRSIGMGGLALGTLLSYIFYLLIVSIHFLKKSNTFRIRPWFSLRDVFQFAKFSLKNNTAGLCMAAASAVFTKAILQFLGSDYLVANTVLCAMMEVYEMINGPSEAAEYLMATYTGEKNRDGIRTLFAEAMTACLLCGLAAALFLIVDPRVLLTIYGVEESPLEPELISCIRYSAIGVIAAALGGFLSDYYGNTGKPLWSCLMVVFRTALFPILFCVTFCVEGGVAAMGMGLMLSQVFAILVFYGFVLVMKGPEAIPYMTDDPDFGKVFMNSFDYTPEEYGRICGWIRDSLASHGVDPAKIKETERLVMTLCKKTEERNGKRTVLGECVLRFIDEPEVIIKDNGELFDPGLEDELVHYHVILSSNSSSIRLGSGTPDHAVMLPGL